MDAISRAISEAASNEDGRSAVHWLMLPEGRTAITEGELAQLKANGTVEWGDEQGCYVLTQFGLDSLDESG